MPHAVLGYSTSIQLRGTSVEIDMSCADISLLPLSVGSVGDMPRPDTQPRNYRLAMVGMTLESVSSTGTGKPDVGNGEESRDQNRRRRSQ